MQNADSFVELVQHTKDVILIDEEEDEESHLFDTDWFEKTSSSKHNDENRFLVTTIFTNTLLKPIRDHLTRSFHIFDTTHFENYAKLLNESRDIWDKAVLFDYLTKPVVQLLKRHVGSLCRCHADQRVVSERSHRPRRLLRVHSAVSNHSPGLQGRTVAVAARSDR